MDGKKIVSVQMDRCWNRNWRCLLFTSIIVMSFIVTAMFFSGRRQRMDGLLETDWEAHWSPKDSSQKASKIVIEEGPAGQGGINVQSHEETLEEYLDKEDDDSMPYDDEHYDTELPEENPETRIDEEYEQQYAQEVKSAQSLRTLVPSPSINGLLAGNMTVSILSSLFTANVKDYTLQSNFRNLFQDLTSEDIEFDTDYTNPCWAESIPRYPYVNNSYLRVSELARELEPEFQLMRKRFAARLDPATKWRLRCLPAFYVMETPPLATPSLFTVLSYHQSVVMPKLQEPEFWNKRGPDGVSTFRDYVDLYDGAAQLIRDSEERVEVDGEFYMKHEMITGDGTSSYLWMFDSWKKVKGNEVETQPKVTAADIIYKLTPLAKFIFVLRNPTERLFQSYLSRSEVPSAGEFHTIVGDAMKNMTKCEENRSIWSCLTDGSFNKNLPVRLRIGMYYPFIADWLRVFPRDQIKVVRYEDYVSRPSEIINEVCFFLGISPFQIEEVQAVEERIKMTEDEKKAEQKLTMLSGTRAMLKEFHRKLNGELATLLDDDSFTWPELSSPPGSSNEQQGSQLSSENEIDKANEQKRIVEDTARKIKEQREKQVAAQQTKLNEYKEKRRQWAVQQHELRQQLLKNKQQQQQQQQQGQQQPQQGRPEEQQQLQRAIRRRQREQQQQQQQQQGPQQPQQGRPEEQRQLQSQQEQQQQQQPKSAQLK